MGRGVMGWQQVDRLEAARRAEVWGSLASHTVDRCASELRQARETARCAREAMRRALREVEAAEDAFHQATQRLDRSTGPRGEGR